MNQTQDQQERVIYTFLRKTKKGRVCDAIMASRWMQEDWGIKYDWHVFATVLSRMEGIGLAQVIDRGPDRMLRYLIK